MITIGIFRERIRFDAARFRRNAAAEDGRKRTEGTNAEKMKVIPGRAGLGRSWAVPGCNHYRPEGGRNTIINREQPNDKRGVCADG